MVIVERGTAVGVFEDRTQAEKAIEELRQAGFGNEQIGLAVRSGDPTAPPPPVEEEGAVAGAAAGAVAGGTLGAVLGALTTAWVPGIGWVIAGGLLAGALGGAALGAAAGGLMGAFATMGLTEEEARYYEDQVRAGHTVVSVRVDGRYHDAADILRRHGAYAVSTITYPTPPVL